MRRRARPARIPGGRSHDAVGGVGKFKRRGTAMQQIADWLENLVSANTRSVLPRMKLMSLYFPI